MGTLKTSQRGLDFIAQHEGVVLHVYKCPAGIPTIGVGHVVRPGEVFPATITREQAFELLAKDAKLCEDAIHKHVEVELNQNQFDALVSFLFNVGTGVAQKSGLATELKAGRLGNVPAEMLKWCKARVNGQVVVLKGLEGRRKAEAALFQKPVDTVPDTEPNALDQDTQALASAALAMSLDRAIREFLTEDDAEPEANA